MLLQSYLLTFNYELFIMFNLNKNYQGLKNMRDKVRAFGRRPEAQGVLVTTDNENLNSR